jgi:hypothetical protein
LSPLGLSVAPVGLQGLTGIGGAKGGAIVVGGALGGCGCGLSSGLVSVLFLKKSQAYGAAIVKPVTTSPATPGSLTPGIRGVAFGFQGVVVVGFAGAGFGGVLGGATGFGGAPGVVFGISGQGFVFGPYGSNGFVFGPNGSHLGVVGAFGFVTVPALGVLGTGGLAASGL